MLDICLVMFMVDVVLGIQAPTFPLYAHSLGASLALIGILTSAMGVTRLVLALPIGILSDGLRKPVLVVGSGLYGLALLLFASAPSAGWLVGFRPVLGIAMIAMFPVGVVYLTEVVRPELRLAAIGLYTASMGAGFAVGPLLGTWLSALNGYRFSYLIGAGLGFISMAYAWARLVEQRERRNWRLASAIPGWQSIMATLADRDLLLACLGNMLTSVSTTGAVLTFFPLYAHQAGVATVVIGWIFGLRAFTSALGRLPAGAFAARLPAGWLVTAAIGAEALIMLGISSTGAPLILLAVLILEGIAFGTFLATSQALISGGSRRDNRGVAAGIYSMAGSFAEMLGALALGVVAQRSGVSAVYVATALLLVVGTCVCAWLAGTAHRRTPALTPC